ncbi:MAG: hypothetical protein NTV34_11850, partial [Proteobacteria bacterium]|nr:hypothetical protein [Pseudomonadota bacterium]
MILSQNAEPFPALGIQRMDAEAFKTKWLHWIGPWSVSSVVSENGPVDYPYVNATDNDLFWFTNITFRPLQSLQFDVTRNVLFSGRERPLTGPMLLNLITLQDSYELNDDSGSMSENAARRLRRLSLTRIALNLLFHFDLHIAKICSLHGDEYKEYPSCKTKVTSHNPTGPPVRGNYCS